MTHDGMRQDWVKKTVGTLVACVCGCVLALPALAESEAVKRRNGVMYIEVEGTPYEMGLRHGRLLAREIEGAVVDYRSNVEKTFGKENAPKIIDWVLNEADFTSDVKKLLPDVWEEMQGIAAGAGVSMDDVVLLQMFEEVYEAAPDRIGVKIEETFGHGCTAFQAVVDGKRFNGQNMDYSGNLQEQQLVTRYKYPDKQILLYGFVGQVGGVGLNSKGLSAFVTTLPQGKKRHRDGLGGTYVLRAVLEQDSVDAAIAFLEEFPRFSSLSYSIADRERSVIVETSADELEVREISASAPFLVQTNHILTLKQRNNIPGFYEGGEPVRDMPFLTLERFEAAQGFLERHRNRLNVKDLKQMLTRPPINIANPTFMTLQSAIAEYDGDKLRLFVSAGHDAARKWNEYGF